MYHAEREIRDRAILKAILDMCDVINIAFADGEYPYILPVNFGYEFEDDLVFYCHHASKGYKNGLIEKNPNVCVVTHKFLDHIYNSYDKSGHDYRSVMAFGQMSFIPADSDEYVKAWEKIASCNGRQAPERIYDPNFRQNKVKMSKIVCRPENVIGKAQRIITSLDQVALKTDPYPNA